LLNRFRKRILAYINQQKGSVLPFAMIIFALVEIMVLPLLDLTGSALKQGSAIESLTDQTYIADAGVESACQIILQSSTGISGVDGPYTITNINGPGSSAQVTITRVLPDDSDGQHYLVSSTGTNSSGATTITARVLYSKGLGLFVNALTTLGGTNSDLNMSGTTNITGNVYTQGDITLSGSATIDGVANASGSVSPSSAGTSGAPVLSDSFAPNLNTLVQGVFDETYTNVAVPIPLGSSVTIAKNTEYSNPVYFTGNVSIANVSNVTFDSQVYIVGNLSFSGVASNINFSGPVYVGGQLSNSGGFNNVTFNSTLTTGSIDLGGSGSFTFNGPVKDLGNLNVGAGIPTSFGSTIYTGGNFSYSGASSLNVSNDIYVKGSLTTSGSAAQIMGPDKVVVRGNLSISGDGSFVKPNSSQFPFIIVPPGSTTPSLSPATNPAFVSISGSGYASALVYAPTAALTLSGTGALYGAAVVKQATLSGGNNKPTIFYPTDLAYVQGAFNGVTVQTWQVN
jgi:hypothetical protein